MNENKPLLGHVVNSNGNNCAKSKSWLGLGCLSIALVGFGVLIGRSMSPSSVNPSSSTSTPPSIPSAEPLVENAPSYNRIRPFCRLHADHVKFAGVLQTSIGDPSSQWSHIPCYSQPKKNMNFWVNQDNGKGGANINGFGSPDAIFRTNFSQLAFPHRPPIVGFGPAFTEASSLNYQSLSDAGKERLMELLFGKNGIGYSVGALNI